MDQSLLVASNIVAALPLDLRDEKTGEQVSGNGYWLNEFARVHATIHRKWDRDKNDYAATGKVSIDVYLKGNAGRKERNYKLDSKGTLSDRFWDSIKEHTKIQLACRAAEAARNALNKGAWDEMDKYIKAAGLKVDEYYKTRIKDGRDNNVRAHSNDGSVSAGIAVDKNGVVHISSFSVSGRDMTPERFGELVTLVGLEKRVVKSVPKYTGELFDDYV